MVNSKFNWIANQLHLDGQTRNGLEKSFDGNKTKNKINFITGKKEKLCNGVVYTRRWMNSAEWIASAHASDESTFYVNLSLVFDNSVLSHNRFYI